MTQLTKSQESLMKGLYVGDETRIKTVQIQVIPSYQPLIKEGYVRFYQRGLQKLSGLADVFLTDRGLDYCRKYLISKENKKSKKS